MKILSGILASVILTCLSSCMDDNTLLEPEPETEDVVILVTQVDFNNLTNYLFKSADYTQLESGIVSNTNDIEFSATYEPNDPNSDLQIEFDYLDSLLNARETFTGHSKGSSMGLDWSQRWSNKKRYIVVEAVILKTGIVRVTCREILLAETECNSPLVTRTDFNNVTDSIFDSTHFLWQQGSGWRGSDGVRFVAVYEPNDPKADLHFDFSAWESFLIERDSLTEHFKGGTQGLYWQQSWTNTKRFIVIEAEALRNGYVQLIYSEILR